MATSIVMRACCSPADATEVSASEAAAPHAVSRKERAGLICRRSGARRERESISRATGRQRRIPGARERPSARGGQRAESAEARPAAAYGLAIQTECREALHEPQGRQLRLE